MNYKQTVVTFTFLLWFRLDYKKLHIENSPCYHADVTHAFDLNVTNSVFKIFHKSIFNNFLSICLFI